MFINNKNGTFHEMKFDFVDPKIKEPATVNPDWTCGADLGDLDNDGDMDMVIGDHIRIEDSVNHRLYVLLNEGNQANGDPKFRDITFESGVVKLAGRAPHVQIQDIDNDGWMDIMVSNAHNLVYQNRGIQAGLPRFGQIEVPELKTGIGYWASAPLGDYDRDGRLDIIGAEWEPAAHSPLLRNITRTAINYIAVKLELETGQNRNGIGSKVEIFQNGMLGKKEGLLGTRLISVSNGYSSGYEAIAYFGVPNDDLLDIRVTMPAGGKVFSANSIKRNQLYIIKK
jgi:hypothetical protein